MTVVRVGVAARLAALTAIRAVEDDGAWSTRAVPDAAGSLAEPRDRALASNLAYETLRWRGTLDWALSHVLDRDPDPMTAHVLRLGAIQILRLRVPDRAAVSTSVEVLRAAVDPRHAQAASGFVNGVLRSLARRRDELPWPDPEHDPVGSLVLTTAHPAWIVEDLIDQYGTERAGRILAADNEPPGLTLRSAGDRDQLLDELRTRGITAQPTLRAPLGVRVPGVDPRSLAAVVEGRARPQDEASMVVADTLQVPDGATVLDLCAGPGGKATHLAQLAGPDGIVVAVDRRPHRAGLVAQAARQLGVRVAVVAADGRRPPFSDGSFDAVLVDAPCTGLGTGRRRPEIRWRRQPDDLASLAALQGELMAAAIPLVRPGGRVVYSVCTWTRAETTAVADSIQTAHPALLGAHREQLLPDSDGTDGMFIASWYCGAPQVAPTPE